MTSILDPLSKLHAPDATIAATKQKIRDAFKGVRPCIAIVPAKEASNAQ